MIKVSREGFPTLIGTVFFITKHGHLITAKHVIEENIDKSGNDIGGIGVILFDKNSFGEFISLASTDWHQTSDIAVSSTRERWGKYGKRAETPYLQLSIKDQPIGANVSSRFYCHWEVAESLKDLPIPVNELRVGTFNLTHKFIENSPGMFKANTGFVDSKYGYQERQGMLRQNWKPMRDKVMLPFPVFESNLAISASGSGGPVFDDQGFVVGINTTGIPGTDISYHTYIESALDLRTRIQLIKNNPRISRLSLRELSELKYLKITGLVDSQ